MSEQGDKCPKYNSEMVLVRVGVTSETWVCPECMKHTTAQIKEKSNE